MARWTVHHAGDPMQFQVEADGYTVSGDLVEFSAAGEGVVFAVPTRLIRAIEKHVDTPETAETPDVHVHVHATQIDHGALGHAIRAAQNRHSLRH